MKGIQNMEGIVVDCMSVLNYND